MRNDGLKKSAAIFCLLFVVFSIPISPALAGPPRQGDGTPQDVHFMPTGTLLSDGGNRAIRDIASSPDGSLFIGITQQANTAGGYQIEVWSPDHETPLSGSGILDDTYTRLALSPDGTHVAALGKTILLWDYASQKPVGTLPPPPNSGEDPLIQAAFTPDGKTLVALTQNGKVAAWDAASQQLLGSAQLIGSGLGVSPDGQRVASIAGQTLAVSTVSMTGSRMTLKKSLTTGGFAASMGNNGIYGSESVIFSPDGRRAVILWDGGQVKLWDLENNTLQDLLPVRSLKTMTQRAAFSPDGSLVAVAESYRPAGQDDMTEALYLWDAAAARLVGTQTMRGLGFVNAVQFSPSQLRLALAFDFQVDLLAYNTPAMAHAPGSGTAELVFTASKTITARYRPQSTTAETCSIAAGEKVLLVAQTLRGVAAAYASGPGCEGRVWLIPSQVENLDGITGDQLNTLPLVDEPPAPAPLDSEQIPNYSDICDRAAGWGSPPPGGPPYRAYSQYFTLPDEMQATTETGVEALVCSEQDLVPVEVCGTYTGSDGSTTTLDRARFDDVISLVDYQTGLIFAQQRFEGGTPPPCPQTTTYGGDLPGPAPDYNAEEEWVLNALGGNGAAPVPRTIVGSGAINARSEPSTEASVVQQLAAGTPVNLIGRTEAGDWVLVLTPDMTRVWLHADLLQFAARTTLSMLPVVSGPAADIPIPLP